MFWLIKPLLPRTPLTSVVIVIIIEIIIDDDHHENHLQTEIEYGALDGGSTVQFLKNSKISVCFHHFHHHPTHGILNSSSPARLLTKKSEWQYLVNTTRFLDFLDYWLYL